jgi:hypothetical protein
VNRQRGQKQYGAKRKGSAFHLSMIDQTRAEGLSLLRTMAARVKASLKQRSFTESKLKSQVYAPDLNKVSGVHSMTSTNLKKEARVGFHLSPKNMKSA